MNKRIRKKRQKLRIAAGCREIARFMAICTGRIPGLVEFRDQRLYDANGRIRKLKAQTPRPETDRGL